MEKSLKLHETLLQRLRDNDPSLVELKLNMHSPKLTDEDIQKLVEALKHDDLRASFESSEYVFSHLNNLLFI